MPGRGPVRGLDGMLRCPWATSAPEYVDYHDEEWGRPLSSDDQMFERMSLEGFQSGLSWLVILRKREAFRKAFVDFSIPKVAAFDAVDAERLLADAGIVRNRAKIDATIANARVVADLPGGLLAFVEAFTPTGRRRAPRTLEDLPAKTAESTALATALRKQGVRFVGPTTAYALMQATGLVNDHLVGCISR
ncbi:MAG TPA: DNA-3-methyladenine glycosylase I [Mycobacteriales bacterium]|nr:DNA-3-methyladenine glycosylase I [Mycobacteriales bacterium]